MPTKSVNHKSEVDVNSSSRSGNNKRPTHKLYQVTRIELARLAELYHVKMYQNLILILLRVIDQTEEDRIKILSRECPPENEKQTTIRGDPGISQAVRDIQAFLKSKGLERLTTQDICYCAVEANRIENWLDHENNLRDTPDFVKPEVPQELPHPEKMDGPDIITVATTRRVHARNSVQPKSKRYKRPKIKLNLKILSNNNAKVLHILDNSDRWTPYNREEIREYMREVAVNVNPVPVDYMRSKDPGGRWNSKSFNSLDERQSLYHVLKTGWKTGVEYHNNVKIHKLDIEWKIPNWLKALGNLTDMDEISKRKKSRGYDYPTIKSMNWTIEEWYAAYADKVLSEDKREDAHRTLRPDFNEVVQTRERLMWTGICNDLKDTIKNALKIMDSIEDLNYRWSELDSWDKREAKRLINTPEGRDHPNAILIREKLKRERPPPTQDTEVVSIEATE